MAKFYRNPEEYANEKMHKVEKENERLNKALGQAESAVKQIKRELDALQNDCPHIITYDNDRVMDAQPTRTCRACGFTA